MLPILSLLNGVAEATHVPLFVLHCALNGVERIVHSAPPGSYLAAEMRRREVVERRFRDWPSASRIRLRSLALTDQKACPGSSALFHRVDRFAPEGVPCRRDPTRRANRGLPNRPVGYGGRS